MARTPLLRWIERSLLARRGLAHRPFDPGRRRVLAASAAGAIALPFLSASSGCSPSPIDVPVAIVGGGMAGLHAAYRLKRRGLLASVFEAAKRLGGRVFTDRDTFAKQSGQHCELGGELIDTGHLTMRDLATELGIELLDYHADDPSLHTDSAFIGGRLVPDAELLAGFDPIAAAIDAAFASATDANALPSYLDDNGLGDYDRMSIADFLDQAGASGPTRTLLEIAYTTEYGIPVAEQSALNLITLVAATAQKIELYGASDERFHAAVGNDAFTAKLAATLDPNQIALEHRLTRVALRSDGRYDLAFALPSGSRDVVADRVLLTLPFTMLRQVDLAGVTLPAAKQRAIAELGYGTNTKLMVGFSSRPWRAQKANGTSYTDLGYQSTWETTRLQPGPEGILTDYTGGAHGIEVTSGTPEKQRDAFLAQLDQVFPGSAAASNGAVARFAWPTYELTRGSYAGYKVGQWTTIAGAEGERVGNLLFAGEHCSRDAQGYMEGAALTGAMAAEQIAVDLGLAAQAASIPARRIALRARLALQEGSWISAMARARRAG